MTYKNFLVFGHNYIGDTLMITPAIRAIKSSYPDSRITVVSSGGASPVLKRNPDVTRIIEISKEKTRGLFGAFGLIGLFLRLKSIEQENGARFDACVNFLTSLKFAFLGFLVSNRQSGEYRPFNNFFLKDSVKFKPGIHNIEKSLRLALPFLPSGIAENFARDYVYDVLKGDIINAGIIVKENRIAVFSPGSTRKTKEASPALFSSFADFLIEKEGLFIIITGARGDKELSAKVLEGIKNKNRCSDITGLTDIYTLGGLIKLASIVVTVDNGTMHLSSAIKTPLIALFGSTDPDVCGPLKNERTYIIDKKQECYHCFSGDCSKENLKKADFPDCMGLITLEDMVNGYGLLKEGGVIK